MAQDFQGNNPAESSAQQSVAPTWLDSVDISLLTCGPGQEVWSYYGHTALRIEDHFHGNDLAVNWGMFSFSQPYFVARFVFGLTDYQIGVFPISYFMEEYSQAGRWVVQQRLALTRGEKMRILQAVDENNREGNRTYRYNFFYDNCTTRARNMVIDHLERNTLYTKNADPQSTYRTEIHRRNENHRWARFGNDLLLGLKADGPIDQQEWEFLPENLMKDFAILSRKDTGHTKLVDKTFYLIPPQAQIEDPEIITPRMMMIGITLVILTLCGIEHKKKKNFWWIDTSLLLLTGLPGLILVAMWFSQHPTVQINFQLLLFNPLNLLFAWQVAQKARKGSIHGYYHVWGCLLVLALLLQIWQTYAEGMDILALSLLMRYALRSTKYDLKKLNKK